MLRSRKKELTTGGLRSVDPSQKDMQVLTVEIPPRTLPTSKNGRLRNRTMREEAAYVPQKTRHMNLRPLNQVMTLAWQDMNLGTKLCLLLVCPLAHKRRGDTASSEAAYEEERHCPVCVSVCI